MIKKNPHLSQTNIIFRILDMWIFHIVVCLIRHTHRWDRTLLYNLVDIFVSLIDHSLSIHINVGISIYQIQWIILDTKRYHSFFFFFYELMTNTNCLNLSDDRMIIYLYKYPSSSSIHYLRPDSTASYFDSCFLLLCMLLASWQWMKSCIQL